MSLKTKINIANIVGILSFIAGMALLVFTPLACIPTLLGAICLYLVGRWKKQEKMELEGRGISVPVPSSRMIKHNMLIAIIGIGVMIAITTPIYLYFSPSLQEEAPVFIGGSLAAYAFIALILWRKIPPLK